MHSNVMPPMNRESAEESVETRSEASTSKLGARKRHREDFLNFQVILEACEATSNDDSDSDSEQDQSPLTASSEASSPTPMMETPRAIARSSHWADQLHELKIRRPFMTDSGSLEWPSLSTVCAAWDDVNAAKARTDISSTQVRARHPVDLVSAAEPPSSEDETLVSNLSPPVKDGAEQESKEQNSEQVLREALNKLASIATKHATRPSKAGRRAALEIIAFKGNEYEIDNYIDRDWNFIASYIAAIQEFTSKAIHEQRNDIANKWVAHISSNVSSIPHKLQSSLERLEIRFGNFKVFFEHVIIALQNSKKNTPAERLRDFKIHFENRLEKKLRWLETEQAKEFLHFYEAKIKCFKIASATQSCSPSIGGMFSSTEVNSGSANGSSSSSSNSPRSEPEAQQGPAKRLRTRSGR